MKFDLNRISKLTTKARWHKEGKGPNLTIKEEKYIQRWISLNKRYEEFFNQFSDPEYVNNLYEKNVPPHRISMLIVKSNAHKISQLEDITSEEKEELKQWASMNEENLQLFNRLSSPEYLKGRPSFNVPAELRKIKMRVLQYQIKSCIEKLASKISKAFR